MKDGNINLAYYLKNKIIRDCLIFVILFVCSCSASRVMKRNVQLNAFPMIHKSIPNRLFYSSNGLNETDGRELKILGNTIIEKSFLLAQSFSRVVRLV